MTNLDGGVTEQVKVALMARRRWIVLGLVLIVLGLLAWWVTTLPIDWSGEGCRYGAESRLCPH